MIDRKLIPGESRRDIAIAINAKGKPVRINGGREVNLRIIFYKVRHSDKISYEVETPRQTARTFISTLEDTDRSFN